jgi:hypothetical protein
MEMEISIGETPQPLPPLKAVATALRAITERLAHELASPQPAAPDWSVFEWRTARAVAAMHGISGLLAGELRWRGPDGWAEFLSRQREHVARRQARICEFLAAVGERFQRQGIPVQALKGAALHLEGLYRHGERPMADLDLLTSPEHAAHAAKILERFGLHESHRSLKERVFEARDTPQACSFGEHPDTSIKVELHERICERLPYRITDISHLVLPPRAVPGLNPYPSRAAFMAHLLLHAAGGMACRTLRLVQLHDITLLARRLTARDWQQLLDWQLWWTWPPLALSEKYYGAAGPQAVTAALRALCPPLLRRTTARQSLTDVSMSRLWLEMLPGIEWAHSAGEAMTFIARRIVPSPEVLSDRKFALATDPSFVHSDWGRLSQGRRILRVVHARTPRPWPVHNVRAALAEPQ